MNLFHSRQPTKIHQIHLRSSQLHQIHQLQATTILISMSLCLLLWASFEWISFTPAIPLPSFHSSLQSSTLALTWYIPSISSFARLRSLLDPYCTLWRPYVPQIALTTGEAETISKAGYITPIKKVTSYLSPGHSLISCEAITICQAVSFLAISYLLFLLPPIPPNHCNSPLLPSAVYLHCIALFAPKMPYFTHIS